MIPAGMTKDQEEAYLCKYQLFSVSKYLYLIVHYMNARLFCVGWSVYVNHNHFFSNIWAFCPNPFFPVQLKIEEASRRLRSGDLGIPLNPEDRFE